MNSEDWRNNLKDKWKGLFCLLFFLVLSVFIEWLIKIEFMFIVPFVFCVICDVLLFIFTINMFYLDT